MCKIVKEFHSPRKNCEKCLKQWDCPGRYSTNGTWKMENGKWRESGNEEHFFVYQSSQVQSFKESIGLLLAARQ